MRTAVGVLRATAAVVVDEVRAGRGRCLLWQHDWWECSYCAPTHRHCRRCGKEG